ncbi:hypothetical protein [Psychrobacter sp. APC 3350]|uniref:hypothetical protein n=1 Tax=Psychrobacter sp. APC 3350 TaxID=3035195 RepID=UPI0025B414EC|nr:hypothetical protein [Psychrobacter sp. APC 3350]MDN3453202.1 hypothetical protein [Psychrobacter sp. APC 3350]
MRKINNFLNKKIIKSLVVIIIISTLPACDKSPSEHLQGLTEDKYPVANMPNEPLETPLEINIEPKRLAMTSSWSAGVKDDGTLWTWGTDGLLRDTKTGQDPTPRQVEGVNDAVAVSGDGSHMLLLRKDGTVWGWGSNRYGEVDPNDDDTFIEELRQIKGISDVVDIEADTYASIFLTKESKVYYLGSNQWHILKNVDKDKLDAPFKISGLKDISRIEGSSGYILALNTQGELMTTYCIKNAVKVFDSDSNEICNIPFEKKVVDFAQGVADFALLEDGSVWSWGQNFNGEAAQGKTNGEIDIPTRIKGLSKVTNISSFAANTLDGQLYTWGHYLIGESPEPMASSMRRLHEPILIKNDIEVSSFSSNAYIAGFTTKNGGVWFWEGNRSGQRGTGEVVDTFYEEYVFTPEKSLFTLN